MKKSSMLLCAGVLVSALCAAVTACNDEPNDPGQKEGSRGNEQPEEQKEEPTGVGIAPVAASEIPEEVAAFFEKYLPPSDYSRPPHEFNFGDVDDSGAVCLIINSTDEFRAIAPPSAELPPVNFEKYTLVIGQHPMGDPGYRLKEQGVDVKADPMTLTLIYDQLEGGTPAIMTSSYYWGLYPKLPLMPVSVNIKMNSVNY
jgi:hypothetical protein